MEVLGGAELTPTQTKAIARSRAFHAEIARRAALVEIKRPLVRFVPNCPYGIPKIALEPEKPAPQIVFPTGVPAEIVFPGWVHKIVQIKAAAANEFGVSVSELHAYNRSRRLVVPRHVAIFLARTLTPYSTLEIGRRFRRDHSVILHAVRVIKRRLPHDADLAARVEKIKAALA